VNIGSVDMAGTIPGSSVTVTTPEKTMEPSHTAPATKGDETVSPDKVKQMVAEMQSHLDSMNISLQYYFYGKHNQKIAIKVVNKETGAVVREIPPKEMQALQTKMSELVGMIFNGKA
jgi:uncharacterized FlaG/YvyC family protein